MSKLEEYKKLFNDVNTESNYGLNEYECNAYAQMFTVINELINDKLDFNDILITYDFFNDVLSNNRPDIEILSENDKFLGTNRLLKRFKQTKNLTDEEREYLAFSLYYATCIKSVDEETKEIKWSLDDFTSAQAIKEHFAWYKEQNPKKFIVPKSISNPKKEDYGLNENNPIEVISVEMEYAYIDAICLEDGTEITTDGKVTTYESQDGRFVDCVHIVTKVKKGLFRKKATDICDLYFLPSGPDNSAHTPKGFRFKEEM